MKFTDDPYILETSSFLMIREVAHLKMFEAALDSIQRDFLPTVLAADHGIYTKPIIFRKEPFAAPGTKER